VRQVAAEVVRTVGQPVADWLDRRTPWFAKWGMGNSMRRDQPWGFDSETLEPYRTGAYELLASCGSPQCGHSRRISAETLARFCPKGFATQLGSIRKRLRCRKCGSRKVNLKAIQGSRRQDRH